MSARLVKGMPNRNLTSEELEKANSLLSDIRSRLKALAQGDRQLEFAYRRKIFKELSYVERTKPTVRRKLKARKRKEQDNRCAECGETLPEKYAVLDRRKAALGYTVENTRLLCESCDRKIQSERVYK